MCVPLAEKKAKTKNEGVYRAQRKLCHPGGIVSHVRDVDWKVVSETGPTYLKRL